MEKELEISKLSLNEKRKCTICKDILNFNNKYCPRDSKDQMKFFKKKILFKDLVKNDLIFWKGHVAILASKKEIIHAYGPLKKTLIMGINYSINRIKNTANLEVKSIKRV